VETASRAARDRRVGVVVVGVVVAAVAAWGITAAVTSRDPEATVEEFLTSVAEKDVEGALALVTRSGYGVPYGDAAAFLTPAAISGDWWVASVAETGRDYGSATVKAVIAGPGGSAEGEFTVTEYDDEWLLSDPFAKVRFPESPLSFLRVNDQIVDRAEFDGMVGDVTLFPGLYRFYQPVADVVDTKGTGQVAVFPPPEDDGYTDEPTVVPALLTPGKRATTALRAAVRDRIDECVGFATAAPAADCPFATDGEIDTQDGRRVSAVRGLTWTVASYPEVTMTDQRAREHRAGFRIDTAKPGAVTLTGTGEDTDDQQVTFTVTCAVDLTGYTATIGADGSVALASLRPGDRTDTCRQS
jgi:hypothetical protein